MRPASGSALRVAFGVYQIRKAFWRGHWEVDGGNGGAQPRWMGQVQACMGSHPPQPSQGPRGTAPTVPLPERPLTHGQEHGSACSRGPAEGGHSCRTWQRPPCSLWSVASLDASAGSWVCTADVLEHEKGPREEPSICQTVSGEPLSFLSDTSQLACLTIHLPKCDRIFSCY